jgi:hypothetical protein
VQLWFKRSNAEANQAKEKISRYRRGWDAGAKADWPDNAADTPGSAASTRPIARAQEEEANWIFCAASLTVTITN